ncbi:MAG: hypothetical protein K2F70_06945 [Muribaculaceae bacterium]|nr:hypothetical protein [Muribaculaceae bacterium]
MHGGLYINENEITRFFHNRGGFLFVALTSVVMTLAAYFAGVIPPLTGEDGLFFLPPGEWIANPITSLVVSLAVNFMTGYAMVLITKQFNTIRSLSRLMATFFIIMQTATPALMGEFSSGTFLTAVMVLETALLFSCYDNKAAIRRIFLLFFILTSCGLCCFSMLLYIPFFLPALAQMRMFGFRQVIAALIGVITPFWLLLGFGIITLDDFYIPEIYTIVNCIPSLTLPQLSVIVLTTLSGIIFMVSNLMKLLSYNAQIRAYNGFLLLMFFATLLLMFVDTNSITVYIPMLNLTAAYQIAHFFAERRHRRSYLAIIATTLPYLAIYLWNL